jgi:hypothetical protein
LRKTGKHQRAADIPFSRDSLDDRGHVGDVIGHHQLAILPRHPTRHDILRSPAIEAMKRLNRDDHPSLGAWYGLQTFELNAGVFRIPVEADKNGGVMRGAICWRPDEVPAMRGDRDRPFFDHGLGVCSSG